MNDVTFLDFVQDGIEQVEDRIRERTYNYHASIQAALDHLLASGGKRIRAAITLLTGNMLNAEPEQLISLAASIESLHTATLVHDDLIDGALIRRGSPTLNAQWAPAATVLTGDFIFAQAAVLAAETNSVSVMQLFARTLATIVNGEITQFFSSRVVVSRENYYQRIYAKTASLFETATQSAALISPVGDETVKLCAQFGYKIGMAFQIVDDILDFTGEQATIGKPVASDLRMGLITLPAIYYAEMYPADRDMVAIQNGNHSSEVNYERLVNSIRESGAIGQSIDEAKKLVFDGLTCLEKLPDVPERQALRELAEFIVRRNN